MNLSLDFSWMAWTWPTATFFLVIAAMLVGMTLWEWAVPGGSPRYGILHIETTRGDRFFITLLGSAFITLAWLGLVGPDLWWALAVCVVWALGVFRWV
jgi:predicted small integral membrane protein